MRGGLELPERPAVVTLVMAGTAAARNVFQFFQKRQIVAAFLAESGNETLKIKKLEQVCREAESVY